MNVLKPSNCGFFLEFSVQCSPTKFVDIWGHMGAALKQQKAESDALKPKQFMGKKPEQKGPNIKLEWLN